MAGVCLLMAVAFGVFYVLKQYTIINYKKYPPTTNCASILNMFGNDFTDKTFIEYANNDKKNTMNNKGTGIY